MKQSGFLLCQIPNQLSFKTGFQKVDQHTGGRWLVLSNKHHPAVRTINWQAWNSLAEYPNWDYKLDIKESDGNMFNPIFLKKAQRQRHPRSWAITGIHYPVVWERFCELEERQYSKTFDQHDITLTSKSHCHSSTMENIVSSAFITKIVKPDTLWLTPWKV